jgi:two-component system, LytTR family, response regulator
MPDISGLDLVRSLKEKPFVIFTTAYRRYAYEGFELEALDYLLKPFDFNRFSKAVSKAIDLKKYKKTEREEDTESLYVYSEYRLVKIALKEIEYIESLEDYIKIILSDGKSVLTLGSMKKVLEKLPPDKFRRIHRSYIIPIAKVKSISNRKVSLSCAVELPISAPILVLFEN